MTDDLSSQILPRKPTPERPLLGLTVLVVEDSRFACEAMRLLCLRSGARIRRADCLASAHRHLAIYRPAAVIIDMGLPDGSGADLIRELAQATPRVPVILGTSGTPEIADEAMVAGADGFIEKPITSLSAFQQALLEQLPAEDRPIGLRSLSSDEIVPDRVALRDDLTHVASVLSAPMDDQTLEYLTQFLGSLAQSANDVGLAEAATSLRTMKGDLPLRDPVLLGQVAQLVEHKMTGTDAF